MSDQKHYVTHNKTSLQVDWSLLGDKLYITASIDQ